MLVPPLADTWRGAGRGAFAPGEEEGCSFHCEETLTDAGNRAEQNKMKTEAPHDLITTQI